MWTPEDLEMQAAFVDVLRDAGFSDEAIFALTTFVALRVTFSMVNDALGARPDPELLDRAPDELVRSLENGP